MIRTGLVGTRRDPKWLDSVNYLTLYSAKAQLERPLNASFMAASVLPLSTAYSISEAFGWERGVGHKFKEAPQFLVLYTAIIIIGAGIVLFVSSKQLIFVLNLPNVVGGMLLPLILVLMILLCNDRRLMGRYVNGPIFNVIAWITTIVMTVLTLLIILTTIFPSL